MAIRLPNNTSYMRRTQSFPGLGLGFTNFTQEAWIRFPAAFNTNAGAFGFNNAGNGRALSVGTDNSSVNCGIWVSQTGVTHFPTRPPAGVWCFVQLSSPATAGGTLTARWAEHGSTTVITTTRANGIEGSVNATDFLVNRFKAAETNGFANGIDIAYLRLLTGPSTEQDFLARMNITDPALSGANEWWDFDDVGDLTGRIGGVTMSIFGTPSTTDSPVLGGPEAPTLPTAPPLALSEVRAMFPGVDRISACHLNAAGMPPNASDITTPQVRAEIDESTGVPITVGIRLSDMLGARAETAPGLTPFTIGQYVVADVRGDPFVSLKLPAPVQAGSTLVVFTFRRLPPATIILEDLAGQSWTSARFVNAINSRIHAYYRANVPAAASYDLSIYDAAFTDAIDGSMALLELRGVPAAPYSHNITGTTFTLPLTLTLASAPAQLPALNIAFMGANYDDPPPFAVLSPIPPANAAMMFSRNGQNLGNQATSVGPVQLVAWINDTATPASVTMSFDVADGPGAGTIYVGMILSFLPTTAIPAYLQDDSTYTMTPPASSGGAGLIFGPALIDSYGRGAINASANVDFTLVADISGTNSIGEGVEHEGTYICYHGRRFGGYVVGTTFWILLDPEVGGTGTYVKGSFGGIETAGSLVVDPVLRQAALNGFSGGGTINMSRIGNTMRIVVTAPGVTNIAQINLLNTSFGPLAGVLGWVAPGYDIDFGLGPSGDISYSTSKLNAP